MIRQLLTSVFCAFALFFLLLTGEDTLHSQKSTYQDSITSSVVDAYLVSQHQFKATSVLKKASVSEADIFPSLFGASIGIVSKTWWGNVLYIERTLSVIKFIPDQRKTISQLLYPFHYFW